jgi:hypothetical protein
MNRNVKANWGGFSVPGHRGVRPLSEGVDGFRNQYRVALNEACGEVFPSESTLTPSVTIPCGETRCGSELTGTNFVAFVSITFAETRIAPLHRSLVVAEWPATKTIIAARYQISLTVQ